MRYIIVWNDGCVDEFPKSKYLEIMADKRLVKYIVHVIKKRGKL